MKLVSLKTKLCTAVAILMLPLLAQALAITVNLSSIKAEMISEKNNDEIYFSITKYSNMGKSSQIDVPIRPTYWLSSKLVKVKNVTLWQGELQANEEVKLILSLLEKDAPPWNLNDHIGSLQLVLKNISGKLQLKWELPNFADLPEIEMVTKGNSGDFIFKGNDSRYRVKLTVVDGAIDH